MNDKIQVLKQTSEYCDYEAYYNTHRVLFRKWINGTIAAFLNDDFARAYGFSSKQEMIDENKLPQTLQWVILEQPILN